MILRTLVLKFNSNKSLTKKDLPLSVEGLPGGYDRLLTPL
jgi:hypothetical protein